MRLVDWCGSSIGAAHRLVRLVVDCGSTNDAARKKDRLCLYILCGLYELLRVGFVVVESPCTGNMLFN